LYCEQSSLQTHIATTESVIVRADEKLTAFMELEAAALCLRPEPFYGALALPSKE
jgi:hypothetical protein